MDGRSRVLLLVITILLLAGSGHTATIRVARDGSADFTVVPEAVSAAAAGDTVRIAPGVYPEVLPFETPGGITEYVAEVEVSELTILGDDRDSVILGPATPAADLDDGPGGIVTSTTGNVRVRGVTVRNLHAGVWGNDAWIDVEDCRFVGNHFGVAATLTGPAMVRNCEFVANASKGVLVYSSRGGAGALVEDCRFVDNLYGVDFQPLNCKLRDCSFEGGVAGAQVSFAGSAIVRNCSFSGILSVGFGILGGSQAYLYDNVFEADMYFNVVVVGLLVGSRNELKGGTTVTLRIPSDFSVLDFHENHILNAGGLSVEAYSNTGPPLRTHDLSRNYWGTTDTEQIDAWIRDRHDDPDFNYIIVDYQPLAEQPIPTESTTFGELKARYGQQ